MAEVGSLSAGAKKARMSYFATNASFLARNGKLAKLIHYNMQYMPCDNALLTQKQSCCPKKHFLPQVFQKVCKS